MSDQFYAARYQSTPSDIHMLAIFSLEEKAKNYAIHLLENKPATAFKFEIKNFVAIIPVDADNLPHYYEDVELIYVNNVIPKV